MTGREQTRRDAGTEVRELLNRLHGEGGHGWIERAAERLTIHWDRVRAELEQAERDKAEFQQAVARQRVIVDGERDLREQAKRDTMLANEHLRAENRLHRATEERLAQVERERDEAKEWARTRTGNEPVGERSSLIARCQELEIRLEPVPALVEALRCIAEFGTWNQKGQVARDALAHYEQSLGNG